LTTVCLLARHLTTANCDQLLREARYKSRRDVERQLAALDPQPAVPSQVRKLPTSSRVRTPEGTSTLGNFLRSRADSPTDSVESDVIAHAEGLGRAPALCVPSAPRPRPAIVTPLAPERYKVQVTIDRPTYEKLRQLQDLFRHVSPTGDVSLIFERAVTLLLADLRRRKLAHVARPRPPKPRTPQSRVIAASVRREVALRDGGQCTFVGVDGRCTERGFLEFHHVKPFATGGPTTSVNLQLRCRAHNAYEAKLEFGDLLAPT
jgi:hypothetical protein